LTGFSQTSPMGRRYVQYVNRTYRRTGTLWDSRYKSSLVEAESYLLCCQRYIELNPVRATMADAPGDYRWSSYRRNAEGSRDRLVTPHALYLALGRDAESREAAYRELFRHHLETEVLSEIRMAVHQSQPVGSTRFFDTIERMRGQRREPKPRGRPRRQIDVTTGPD
jgi:putative transposase